MDVAPSDQHEGRLRRVLLEPEPRKELEELPTHLLPIVIGAHLEDLLSEVLQARLPNNKGAADLAGGAGRTSYSQLVKLASAIGVIGPDVKDALTLVGRIRNHFAHNPKPSEVDQEARKHLEKLIVLYLTKLVEVESQGQVSAGNFSDLVRELRTSIEQNSYTRDLLIDIYLELRGSLEIIWYMVNAIDGRISVVEPRGIMVHQMLK